MKLSAADIYRAEQNGIARATLDGRIRRGWDKELAISNPVYVRPGKEQEDFITPEQYAQAEANGISNNNMWRRVHNQRWSIEDAMTKPVKERGRHKRESKYGIYAKIAEEKGIPFKTFCARVNLLGWDLMKAASTPLKNKRKG